MTTTFLRAALVTGASTSNITFKCIPVDDSKLEAVRPFIGRRFRSWRGLRLSFMLGGLQSLLKEESPVAVSTYDKTKHLLTMDVNTDNSVLIVAELCETFYIVGLSDSTHKNKAYKFV